MSLGFLYLARRKGCIAGSEAKQVSDTTSIKLSSSDGEIKTDCAR